ncbi:cob(I)yrinic acid a,c-diamide adenosyltransferase [Selenomonas sp. TAMA-11512]|nr:cob(I)yrinic acid a,c-diamide adenosyltransferase [Selenomonas sp. TAMA-11512]
MHGLTIVHTGDGKGKTTAALGLALRAWGNGLSVCILQFIKGKWKYGELKSIEVLQKIDDRIEIHPLGAGFSKRTPEKIEEHRKKANEALALAREEMHSQKWNILILDEINYAIDFGLLDEEDVIRLIEEKPSLLHLVLTGRNATKKVIEAADLVTRMEAVKHPFQQGIEAQIGIEF